MKKLLFILTIVILGVSSCKKEEIKDIQDDSIIEFVNDYDNSDFYSINGYGLDFRDSLKILGEWEYGKFARFTDLNNTQTTGSQVTHFRYNGKCIVTDNRIVIYDYVMIYIISVDGCVIAEEEGETIYNDSVVMTINDRDYGNIYCHYNDNYIHFIRNN